MSEIKISVSERLDEILQKLADNLGIKKAELVKNFVLLDILNGKKSKNCNKIKTRTIHIKT